MIVGDKLSQAFCTQVFFGFYFNRDYLPSDLK